MKYASRYSPHRDYVLGTEPAKRKINPIKNPNDAIQASAIKYHEPPVVMPTYYEYGTLQMEAAMSFKPAAKPKRLRARKRAIPPRGSKPLEKIYNINKAQIEHLCLLRRLNYSPSYIAALSGMKVDKVKRVVGWMGL